MDIYSFSPFGYEGTLVGVEVDVRRGIPAIDIVGLADGAVRESRERMKSAIRNSGFEFPPERVLISLSPADLRKEGAGFDLAVALAVLMAKENPPDGDSGQESGRRSAVLVMGELDLNGRVRAVRGIHAALSTACEAGIRRCIIPEANRTEALGIPGMEVYGADTLGHAFRALGDSRMFSRNGSMEDGLCGEEVEFPPVVPEADFSAVRGQRFLLRGLQIAAAGGHNLLAFGPPGCGKTLALQRFGQLLPLLTVEEAQSVTRIHSIAGLLPPDTKLMRTPPVRQPHQSASMEGICGGGTHCSPGDISLSHNGVLFLDEAPEFKSAVLQMLRVPLESGSVTISRAGRSTVFPASFQLLLAANPCPCGAFGSKDRMCLCSAHSIEQYWRKLSGPLLDRVDMRIPVERSDGSGWHTSTESLRKGIAAAVLSQRRRQKVRNARLSARQIEELCPCTETAREILETEAASRSFSDRARASCLKLARTICDMEGKETIEEEHMREAVSYRGTGSGIPWEP